MFCTMIFNEMVLKVTSVRFNQGSRALWVTWNKGFVTGVRTYTTLGETEEVNVQKGMDGWAQPLTRALQREVVNKGVEGHCLCLWPGLEHVSRAGGQEESWMQNGRGQRQSRSHGSKVGSTGTNCHVHLPLTAWNPKPAVPPRREGSALDAELHVCPAQDSEPARAGEAVGPLATSHPGEAVVSYNARPAQNPVPCTHLPSKTAAAAPLTPRSHRNCSTANSTLELFREM